ncbi:MAG: transketolase C-terminal domain-containing protein [Acidobacteriota bacterium]
MATDRDPTARTREDVLRDYRIAWESRHASLIGRREVLTGKAKFGIFGDGKEVPQLAMARAFRAGDWRSGYYRDQTFMLAAGMATLEQLFAQLYADPDPEHEPMSSGRQMNCHFATRSVDEDGAWLDLTSRKLSAADTSPTGSQMPRAVGLAYASTLYRHLAELQGERFARFSSGGDEVAFTTIGNASCAEGMFWESVNALGVLGAPAVMSIWDDDYGISVPNEKQLTKSDLSALLSGFARRRDDDGNPTGPGFDLYTVRGWDYAELCRVYEQAAETARREHVPALVHVVELTQPQGHSTSGSHERYKSSERLSWETEHDGLRQMRRWILEQNLADEPALDALQREAEVTARAAQRAAWDAFVTPIRAELDAVAGHIERAGEVGARADAVAPILTRLRRTPSPLRRHLAIALRDALFALRDADDAVRAPLIEQATRLDAENRARYATHLLSEGARSPLAVDAVPPAYDPPTGADEAPELNGFEILNRFFDSALARHPELIAFGEDVGRLGDVNQGFAGLQATHGELRVADTGIRECTILGQAIGMAMRGLRPLCEIQYLDYVHYALQTISDDLATLRWRSRGGQKAPVIIRTRGHRLEGVWHSGSPMGGILHLVRGVHVCVPRDMTRAAGMYATLLRGDDPALVIEVLNGYRVKERLPSNLDDFTVPLGVPEVLRAGDDVTVVTYGACCRLALDAAARLDELGIDVEVIDVQTLLPFDRVGVIAASVRRTSRLVVVDEDVPGGASAYITERLLREHEVFHWLDAPPVTLSAAAHRPAYGSDGDYWSKPQVETLFDAVHRLVHEAEPARFPLFQAPRV